MLKMKYSTQ